MAAAGGPGSTPVGDLLTERLPAFRTGEQFAPVAKFFELFAEADGFRFAFGFRA
jgi:hypothetical protein